MANESLQVTTYPLTDFAAMSAAFKILNDQNWRGKIQFESRGGNQPPEYFMAIYKGSQNATLYIGDALKSIGGGVLMTQQEYDQLFG